MEVMMHFKGSKILFVLYNLSIFSGLVNINP